MTEETHPTAGLLLLASDGVVLDNSVHLVGCSLGWFIASAFLCDDVDEDRPHCLCSLDLCMVQVQMSAWPVQGHIETKE